VQDGRQPYLVVRQLLVSKDINTEVEAVTRQWLVKTQQTEKTCHSEMQSV
jgi:hypothetical protein